MFCVGIEQEEKNRRLASTGIIEFRVGTHGPMEFGLVSDAIALLTYEEYALTSTKKAEP